MTILSCYQNQPKTDFLRLKIYTVNESNKYANAAGKSALWVLYSPKTPKPLCLPSHFKTTSYFQLEPLKKMQAAMEPILRENSARVFQHSGH